MKNRQDRICLNDITEEKDIGEVQTIAIYLFGAYMDTLGRIRDLNNYIHELHSSEQTMIKEDTE